MDKTPEAEANAILNDCWQWLRDNDNSDDYEGRRHQVRMVLAVALGMCRPSVPYAQLRFTLRELADDERFWMRVRGIGRHALDGDATCST